MVVGEERFSPGGKRGGKKKKGGFCVERVAFSLRGGRQLRPMLTGVGPRFKYGTECGKEQQTKKGWGK